MPVRAGQRLPVNPDIWAGVANVPFPPQAPPVSLREDYAIRYADGLVGPITIYSPSSAQCNVAPEQLLLFTD